jgi:hypothetical protein
VTRQAAPTPGPWTYQLGQIIADGPKGVLELATVNGEAEYGPLNQEANGLLMAAAPEMLEALTIFLESFEAGLITLPKTGLAIARVAVAKSKP